MHDSVKAGLCNQLTLEHVVPVRDWQLTCKDCCLSVVSVIYDLLKIVLQLPFQSDHAKVVYDKQVVCVELAEEVGLSSFEMYEFEVLDEHVHREVKHLDAMIVQYAKHRASASETAGSPYCVFRSIPVHQFR